MQLTQALRAEYVRRWTDMQIRPEWVDAATRAAKTIHAGVSVYRDLAAKTGVPWWVIGLIHQLESGCDFHTHLHNGDQLAARTKNEPRNRPPKGTPPFSFIESALDALAYDGLTKWTDWTIAGVSFKLEGFNGFGYRNTKDAKGKKLTDGRPMPSPYLYSGSGWYKKGKYKSDGVFDGAYVSKQVGCLVILKALDQLEPLGIKTA